VPRADEITVRMLLGHRSGIPDFLGQEMLMAAAADQGHIWTLEEFLTAAEKQPPTGAPGTTYSYSNTNYVLLGEILRAQTGRDWRDVVTDNVVKRANMLHTSLPVPGDRVVPAPFNRGYLDLGAGWVDFTTMDPSMAGASGGHGLVTTPADLTTFLQALMAGKLFDRPAILDQMLSFLPGGEPGSPETEYGLGIQVSELDGTRLVGHMGRTAGYWGFVWQLPETGYFVTGAINSNGDLGAFASPIVKRLSR
jgi:D-alanyl-D-alanine carboxypeptidase